MLQRHTYYFGNVKLLTWLAIVQLYKARSVVVQEFVSCIIPMHRFTFFDRVCGESSYQAFIRTALHCTKSAWFSFDTFRFCKIPQ